MPEILLRQSFSDTIVTVTEFKENPFPLETQAPLRNFVEDHYWLVQISILPSNMFLLCHEHQYRLVIKKPDWKPEFHRLCGKDIQFINGDENLLKIDRMHCFDHTGGYDVFNLILRSLRDGLMYEMPFVLEHEIVT